MCRLANISSWRGTEGWHLLRKESALDVLTQQRVMRPIFSDPQIWEKRVIVEGNDKQQINFVLSEK